jgi:acyl-CoA dehydrogenase
VQVVGGSNPLAPTNADLREGVRALCARFDGAYWRKVDEARAYPEEFVDRADRKRAGSALIPEAVRRLGPVAHRGLVIMEEIALRRQFRAAATGRCTT